MLYDVFISHASEDKESLVRPLAQSLKDMNIEVWYDEFSLVPGDSLRQSIDKGLSKSRYGIVVLSHNFFNKKWTNWELDGLLQKQFSGDKQLIIPIWHDIDRESICDYSLSLADKVAIVTTGKTINNISQMINKIVNPEGSTLLIARDLLLKNGINPPVVTDDWWLDIVEYSGSNPVEGTFQESMGWGYFGFPLPPKGDTPVERGQRLGQAALQSIWQDEIYKQSVTQITHPEKVLDFIKKQPGLLDTCLDYPQFVCIYTPQLIIKEFSDVFSNIFDHMYQSSINHQRIQANQNSRSGTALTIDGSVPKCDEIFSLRDDEYGKFHYSHIACNYFQGPIHGPSNSIYDNIDYVAWLLSSKSSWLPDDIHNVLITGIKEWGIWPWDRGTSRRVRYEGNEDTGWLFRKMYNSKSFNTFKMTPKALSDLKGRLGYSVKLLDLPETVDDIINNFLSNNFIKYVIEEKNNRRKNN